MTQHILDRKRDASAVRTGPYLDPARASGAPHPASQSLMKRPRPEPARMDVFSALERAQARADKEP